MSSKILSMAALQRICRESKGTDGIRSSQLVRALMEAGLPEADATVTGADFFRDFDPLHRGVLSVKLFLDNYKLMTTLAIVKDLLSTPGVQTVSLEQLTKVLATKLEADVSARQAQQMFDALDTDRSGSISTDELVQFRDQTEATIQRSKDANVAAAVRETFDHFDRNGAADGKLDSQEFRHLCASLGEVLSDADHEALYNRVNTNGDGITYEQFSSWFLNPNRAPSGQHGVTAAVLRARLMVGRGNNWLRTLVSKGDVKSATSFSGALEAGAPFEDIKAILSVNLEEFHLDDDHKNWLGTFNGAAYVAFDFQTTHADFIESLLQPIVTLFNKTASDDSRAPRVKVTRPNPDTIRCSLGLPTHRDMDSLNSGVEEAKSLLQGAFVEVEFPYDDQHLADNFNTMTLGDFLACRLRVAGNVPPAELRQMGSGPAREISGMLGTGGLPILADVIDGKTGDLGAHNIQHLLTPLLNRGGAQLLEEIKRDKTLDSSRVERFFVKTSDGRYMNSDGGFDSEKQSVSLAAGSSDALPRYTLQHKCSGRYAKPENGRWVGSETKAFVRVNFEEQDSDNYPGCSTSYFLFRHVASGRYACRTENTSNFGATTEEPTTLEVKTNSQGSKYICSPFIDGFLQHSGDYAHGDVALLNYDSAFRFDDAGNGRVFVCSPAGGRLSVHSEGKLFVPISSVAMSANKYDLASEGGSDDACLWELIETTKPTPVGHRIVTLRNRGNGQYAARHPRKHWTTTRAPTRLLLASASDAAVHIRQLDAARYMCYFPITATVREANILDEWSAWNIVGNTSDGFRFSSIRRDNAVLAVSCDGKLYAPNGSDGVNNDANSLWDIAYDVPREIPEEEQVAETEFKHVHFGAEATGELITYFSDDKDHGVYTILFQRAETKWDMYAAPGGQPNEFIVEKEGYRYLGFDSSTGTLRVPLGNELSDEEKVWILTAVADEQPDRFFSIMKNNGSFVMHGNNNGELRSQAFADSDTTWKASYADGGFTLAHRSDGYLTDQGTCSESKASAVKVTFEADEGGEKKQDDPAPDTFLEWKMKNVVQLIAAAMTARQRQEASNGLLASVTAQRVAGKAISEVTAVHGRLASGFGASLRARGLSRPAAHAALLQRVLDLIE